jgi:hypothetical protein
MERAQLSTALPRRSGTVERAFEIVRSGGCQGMSELVQMLKAEKHESVEEHLGGQSIRRDLRRAWKALPNSTAEAEPAAGKGP